MENITFVGIEYFSLLPQELLRKVTRTTLDDIIPQKPLPNPRDFLRPVNHILIKDIAGIFKMWQSLFLTNHAMKLYVELAQNLITPTVIQQLAYHCHTTPRHIAHLFHCNDYILFNSCKLNGLEDEDCPFYQSPLFDIGYFELSQFNFHAEPEIQSPLLYAIENPLSKTASILTRKIKDFAYAPNLFCTPLMKKHSYQKVFLEKLEEMRAMTREQSITPQLKTIAALVCYFSANNLQSLSFEVFEHLFQKAKLFSELIAFVSPYVTKIVPPSSDFLEQLRRPKKINDLVDIQLSLADRITMMPSLLKTTDYFRNTVLHKLISSPLVEEITFLDTLKALVKSGANPDWPNYTLNTPLHIAAAYKKYSSLLFLTKQSHTIFAQNYRGKNIIHILCTMPEAANFKEGNDLVTLVKKDDGYYLNSVKLCGRIESADEPNSSYATIESIVKDKPQKVYAQVLNAQDTWGKIPLFYAYESVATCTHLCTFLTLEYSNRKNYLSLLLNTINIAILMTKKILLVPCNNLYENTSTMIEEIRKNYSHLIEKNSLNQKKASETRLLKSAVNEKMHELQKLYSQALQTTNSTQI